MELIARDICKRFGEKELKFEKSPTSARIIAAE